MQSHIPPPNRHMPFPSLIMGLMAMTRLKIQSSLTIVQRDYPIGAHTVTQSKAHIIGARTGISQIPRDDVEEEGGDTEEEIDRFTSALEGSAQPSSQAQARGPSITIPCAAHLGLVCLYPRPDYCAILTD